MARIDILKAFEEKPQELDFVLPSFLMGTVGSLVAPGASGKSFFSLQACMSVACAVAGGDLLNLNPTPGQVIYFNAEDPDVIVNRRLHAIGCSLTHEAKKSIAQNLHILTVMGKRLNIVDDKYLKSIIDYATGARLIVFDTLSRIHQLDENNNSQAAIVMGCLEHIAAETGASVLFLHHVSKASALGGMADLQQAARGASVLVDNSRWCGYVSKMSKDEAKCFSDREFDKRPITDDFRSHYIRFGVSKQNYGVPFIEKWLKFHDGGVLKPVYLYGIEKNNKKVTSKKGVKHDF